MPSDWSDFVAKITVPLTAAAVTWIFKKLLVDPFNSLKKEFEKLKEEFNKISPAVLEEQIESLDKRIEKNGEDIRELRSIIFGARPGRRSRGEGES